jgi:hypothetical protein
MPHRSIRERTAELDRALLSPDRYIAAKLELRSSTGETLLVVGGRWNKLVGRFEDDDCEAHIVRLKESQDEIGVALADYVRKRLAGDDSRPLIMLGIGNRGGGKTFFCAIIMVVVALALPHTWQIGVSITQKQNREIKDAIAQIAPAHWILDDKTDLRDPRTIFVTNSTVMWLTSKNYRALRMAQLPFEHVCINEGQDQREEIYLNAVPAVRKGGGLVSIATNPPQDASGLGDWVAILFMGLQGRPTIGVAFVLEASKNDAVNQAALDKIREALLIVSKEAAGADADGIIKLAGTMGYPGFSARPRREEKGRWVEGHVGEPLPPLLDIFGMPVPGSGWVDETRSITQKHARSPFDWIAGCDFQTDPGCCAAVGKLYRIPTGQIVLYIREFVGLPGTEAELTVALNGRGYYPGPVDYEGRPAQSCLLVGDATGARQNSEHRKRDPYSFTRLRAEGGWNILPPSFIRNLKGGITPWNPLIPDSRKQMKACLITGLILFSPRCEEAPPGFPPLLESMARAKVTLFGKFEKRGHHTHGPDGVRYLAWRFLPRNDAPSRSAPRDIETFEELRRIRPFDGE